MVGMWEILYLNDLELNIENKRPFPVSGQKFSIDAGFRAISCWIYDPFKKKGFFIVETATAV